MLIKSIDQSIIHSIDERRYDNKSVKSDYMLLFTNMLSMWEVGLCLSQEF